MDNGEAVNSVIRALKVLEALNRLRATSLETLHQATGLPKATLVRLLETLTGAGYVRGALGQAVSRKWVRVGKEPFSSVQPGWPALAPIADLSARIAFCSRLMRSLVPGWVA